MKTITIPIDKGYKFDSVDESNQIIKLVEIPLDIKERIKDFADVLKENGKDPFAFNDSIQGLTKDEIAYKQLKLIAKTFNEGWTPDWSNGNEYKYYPWFVIGSPAGVGFSYHGCDGWTTDSCVGSRLCFKSSALAKHVGNLFLNIYQDFLTL
jgi:hypothetical protein